MTEDDTKGQGSNVTAPQVAPQGASSAHNNGFTAMVVDDHPLLRESMVARLRAMGAAEVVEAASIAEARARANAIGPCDLCILDLGLPDGNGLDLLGELRAEGWTRLVVLSAADDPYSVRAAFVAGAQGYLLKSASPAVVSDGVRRVLDGGVYADPSVASLLAAGLRGGRQWGLGPVRPGDRGAATGCRRQVEQGDRRGVEPVGPHREEPPGPDRPQARHRRPS